MHKTILLALVICVVFSLIAYVAGQAIADAASDAAALKKEYKDRSTKIDDKKADAAAERLKLAQWAQSKGLLEEARAELKRCLKLSPNNERAERLLSLVEADIQAARDGKTPAADPATPPPAAGTAGVTAPADGRSPAISDLDINKIKWTELRQADGKSPGVSADFKKVTYEYTPPGKNRAEKKTAPSRQQYVDLRTRLDPKFDAKKFLALPIAEQLIEIRETSDHGGVDIYKDIIIKSDPKFMQEFRAVWPSINQTCASTRCHGAAQGKGEFKLFPRASANEKVDYANFLILNLWEKNGKRLIDRDRPEDSLVLQYGLPRDKAKAGFKHPVVADWKASFDSTDKGSYAKFESFIKDLTGARTPNYGTEYQPPVGRKLSGGGAMNAFSGLADDEGETADE